MGNGNKIDFTAYCTAFKALDAEMAESICLALDRSEQFWTPYMYEGKRGDGYVLVPSYKDILGERQVESWRQLYQDGTIYSGTGSEAYRSDGIDETAALYFIAGAFGVGELDKSGENGARADALDSSLIAGIQKLYRSCLANGEACLKTNLAENVSSRWKTMVEDEKELDRLTGEIGRLLVKLGEIEAKVNDKAGLGKRLSTYRNRVSTDPATVGDAAASVESLNTMIGMAERYLEEEKTAMESQTKEDLIRKGDKMWEKAALILKLAEEQDGGPGGIDPDDLQKIVSKHQSTRMTWRPAGLEEAQRYYDHSKKMLEELLEDDSAFETIEERAADSGCEASESHTSPYCSSDQDSVSSDWNDVSCEDVGVSASKLTSKGYCSAKTRPDKPEKVNWR